eukprot:CAMPEP_0183549224 /NCGR_PEP_ID=MMETSP0371-20130417/63116_1 /TAXON_ID=268820 /ORGANISM="Peridinium aciculiferum, Strain PAER-2" /LENGTH=98 /DNA_ID=CAMNT_0025752903 /DNA_START=13 /DNA_END=306 /DNA_ORIENTATION=+
MAVRGIPGQRCSARRQRSAISGLIRAAQTRKTGGSEPNRVHPPRGDKDVRKNTLAMPRGMRARGTGKRSARPVWRGRVHSASAPLARTDDHDQELKNP